LDTSGSDETRPEDIDGTIDPRLPVASPLISCERLTPPSHFQDVRLVEVKLAAAYQPGDVAVIQPANLQDNVDTFFSLFPELERGRSFLLEQLDPNIPLPPR
jgi:sulfite reductase alpha subunit-like flavoprotein